MASICRCLYVWRVRLWTLTLKNYTLISKTVQQCQCRLHTATDSKHSAMMNVPIQLTTLATAIAFGRGPWRNSSAPIIIGIGPTAHAHVIIIINKVLMEVTLNKVIAEALSSVNTLPRQWTKTRFNVAPTSITVNGEGSIELIVGSDKWWLPNDTMMTEKNKVSPLCRDADLHHLRCKIKLKVFSKSHDLLQSLVRGGYKSRCSQPPG